MNFLISEENGILQLKLDGDIDLYNVYYIKEELKDKLSEKKFDLTLDLSGVSYIDSSGMGLIVEIKKIIEGDGKTYKVLNIPNSIKQLFSEVSLDILLKDNIVE